MKCKKYCLLCCLLLFGILLVSCGGQKAVLEEQQELVVFAATSLREPLTELIEIYRNEHPELTIVASFDSSGTLKTQIISGVTCDVFLSAAQKPMDLLEAQGLTYTDSRADLLINKVVLVASKEKAAEIDSFSALTQDYVRLISVGNLDVPVGQYAKEIMVSLQIWDVLNGKKKLTFATNAKEIVTQVMQGAVDCGIVYETDAKSAGLPIVMYAQPQWHEAVVYPAAIMKHTKLYDEAELFIQFIREEGKEVFRKYGFTVID